MFLLYRPGAFFTFLSVPFWTLSVILGMRFLWLVYGGAQVPGRTYIPSLLLLLMSATFAFLLDVLAIVGVLFSANRRLAEESICLQYRRIGQ